MIPVAVLFFVSLAGSTPAALPQAQTSTITTRSDEMASMSGTVHDLSGAVVAGATIVVRNGSKDAQAATGPDGRFTITAPASGDVSIRAEAAGVSSDIGGRATR